MDTSGTAVRRGLARIGPALLLGSLFFWCGCGSAWTAISPDTLENQGLGEGDMIRLILEDGQVFDFRLSRVEYPYVWGQRFIGERMPRREMRLDLQQVARVEIKR